MLDESYTLEYTCMTLEDMTESKREIFEGSLRKYVISTVQVRDLRVIRFYFYKDHFLEAVARWPWLLCSNLGVHLEPNYDLGGQVTYQQATQGFYNGVISGGPKRYKP